MQLIMPDSSQHRPIPALQLPCCSTLAIGSATVDLKYCGVPRLWSQHHEIIACRWRCCSAASAASAGATASANDDCHPWDRPPGHRSSLNAAAAAKQCRCAPPCQCDSLWTPCL